MLKRIILCTFIGMSVMACGEDEEISKFCGRNLEAYEGTMVLQGTCGEMSLGPTTVKVYDVTGKITGSIGESYPDVRGEVATIEGKAFWQKAEVAFSCKNPNEGSMSITFEDNQRFVCPGLATPSKSHECRVFSQPSTCKVFMTRR